MYLPYDEEHSTLQFTVQYKHSGMFANRKCATHLRNQLKMQPHYSQSRRENATPFSGPSLLASYNEVPPPPP